MDMQKFKWIAALIILSFSCLSPIYAADAVDPAGNTTAVTTPAANGNGDTTPPVQLSPIEERIAQIEADTAMDPEQKQKLIGVYKSTIEQNKLAASMAAKAEAFQKAKTEAPDKIAAIKKSIEEPSETQKVEIPANATLDEMSQILATEESKLNVAKKLQEDIKTKIETRKTRQTEILELSAKAKNRLQEISVQQPSAAVGAEVSELDKAVAEQTKAIKKAIEQEIKLYEAEVASYQAEAELLNLRKDSAQKQMQKAEESVKKLQGIVNAKRKQEAEIAAREAEIAASRSDPAIKHIAEENSTLAQERTSDDSAATKIVWVTQRLGVIEKSLKSLTDNQKIVQQKIDAAGLDKLAGILLQKQKKELPNKRALKGRIGKTKSEITLTRQHMIEIEEKLLSVDNIEERVQEIVENLDPQTSEYRKEGIEKTAREMLQTQREYLNALYNDDNTYFSKLYDLYDAQNQWLRTTENFQRYINENILWFRTYNALGKKDISNTIESAKWLVSQKNWSTFYEFLSADVKANPVVYSFVFLICLLLMLRIISVNKKLNELNSNQQTPTSKLFIYSVHSLFYSAQISITPAVPAMLLAWRITYNANVDDFSRSIAYGLFSLSLAWMTVGFLNRMFMSKGTGAAHLKWNVSGPKVISRNLRLLSVVFLPAAFIFTAMQGQPNEIYNSSLGRIAFVIAMVAISACIYMTVLPMKLFKKFSFMNMLLILCVLMPLVMGFIAATGYLYTAYVIAIRLLISLWLVLGIAILDSLLKRLIYVFKWNMAVKKHEQKLLENKDTEKSETDKVAEKAYEPKISDLGQQARKLRRMLTGLLFIVGLWVIWVDVLPALGILDKVQLWYNTVDQIATDENGNQIPTIITEPVTLSDLCMSIGVLVIMVVATKNIAGFLEITILRRMPLSLGTKFAITAISRYLIIMAGIITAFAIISIGWSKVQWLAAGFSVGLGFGLQEIFSNFISGIIILFEQPIRIGDTVTIGDVSGIITKIKSRATTITTWERKEMIVPNKEFITSRLVNWSLSDKILRVEIPVGIAYGSDTQKAFEVLMKAASEHPLTIADPAPQVLFLRFDDSALYFEVRVFITSIDSFLQIKHELHMQIDKALREANVTIAFPQMDVHIKTDSEKPVKEITQPSE